MWQVKSRAGTAARRLSGSRWRGRSLQARGMHSADELWRLDAGAPDLLPQGRAASARRQLGRHPPAGLHASIQRLDDADVGDAFLTGRLRLGAVEHAVGEVDELRRELVALLVSLLAIALAQAQCVLDA